MLDNSQWRHTQEGSRREGTDTLPRVECGANGLRATTTVCLRRRADRAGRLTQAETVVGAR